MIELKMNFPRINISYFILNKAEKESINDDKKQ